MTTTDIHAAFDAPMLVGECPLWHPADGALYWVDIGGFTIHRLHPASGRHDAWRMASEPASLAIHASGGLVVALRSGFAHFDPASGSVKQIAPAPYDPAIMRFNDGRVDAAGRFWVGTIFEPRDRQGAEMYCLEKGQVSLKWSGGMTNSNGLGFSIDQTGMYHADTTTHCIRRYDFDVASGTASSPQCFQQFSTDKANNYGGRPDGAAVDSEDCYWIAMFEGGRLLRFAPDGSLLREVALPVRCPTMLAFGGDDLRTLYITSASHGRPALELEQYPLSGRLLAMRLDVAGRVEHAYEP
ncbi:MAG: SMP-30/gluconolactonase/LRE family protein [Pseudomonadota bacterium]